MIEMRITHNARVTELAYVFGSNPKFCGFESHLEHQLAGSVNTFTDSGSKNVGFFPRVSYPLKANPVYIPFRWHAVPFESGEGNIQYSTYER